MNNVTYNYDLAVPVKGDLKFILADPNHPQVYGSGVIKAQSLPKNTGSSHLSLLAGNWAMGFFGVDPAAIVLRVRAFSRRIRPET